MGVFDKDLASMQKVQTSDVYNSEWVPVSKTECQLSSFEYSKVIGHIKLMEGSTIKLPFAWTVQVPYEYRHCSNELSGRAANLEGARKFVEALCYWIYPKKPVKKKTALGRTFSTFAGMAFADRYRSVSEDGDMRYEFLDARNFRIQLGDNTSRVYEATKTDSHGSRYSEIVYRVIVDEDIHDYYMMMQYANGIMDVVAIYDLDIIDALERLRFEDLRRTALANVNNIFGTTIGQENTATTITANTLTITPPTEPTQDTPTLRWLDDLV